MGWLPRFLRCHGFRLRCAHGKSASADDGGLPKRVRQLRELIAQYHPSDVYNMDETAFYYAAVSRRSVCLVKAPALKQNKSRLTVAVAANAEGAINCLSSSSVSQRAPSGYVSNPLERFTRAAVKAG
ncbi:hypothetical protein PybrP1_001737 [[Pythium] brassicae (nom. inval.)]|nr:hypothetical protein PybrP1_001737 [[Pythium] brassicae (nom. inval.)]